MHVHVYAQMLVCEIKIWLVPTTHTPIHTHLHTYTHTYTHTCTQLHTHLHTPTHTLTINTFACREILFLDTTLQEEYFMDGSLVLSLNHHRELCTLQLNGGVLFTKEQVSSSSRCCCRPII